MIFFLHCVLFFFNSIQVLLEKIYFIFSLSILKLFCSKQCTLSISLDINQATICWLLDD